MYLILYNVLVAGLGLILFLCLFILFLDHRRLKKTINNEIHDLRAQLALVKLKLEERGAKEPQKQTVNRESPLPLQESCSYKQNKSDDVSPPSTKVSKPAESSPTPHEMKTPQTQARNLVSIELLLGTKWLNWVGILFVLLAATFFLNYAYSNNWISEKMRLTIGILAGFGIVGLGEFARSKKYPILADTLSGGGLGILYICVFFAYRFYHFIPSHFAFAFSFLLTIAAVLLSVYHSTPYLCLFAQIGGYLSPFLFHSGESNDIGLFAYILILNGLAMGSAVYRQWNWIHLLAFMATHSLFGWWIAAVYSLADLTVGLSFAGLFYIQFLLTPLVHAYMNKVPATPENLRIVLLSIFAAFLHCFAFLYENFYSSLGAVLFLMGFVLLGLTVIWNSRCKDDEKTTNSLIIAALSILLIAVPIQFDFYAVPIAWITQAVLLAYVASQYERLALLSSCLGALGLSIFSLLQMLPLHTVSFVPIFNTAFGSFVVVIVGCFVCGCFLRKGLNSTQPFSWIPNVAGLILIGILLHFEVHDYWAVQLGEGNYYKIKLLQYTSLFILWNGLTLLVLEITVRNENKKKWMICWVALCIAIGTWIGSLYYSPAIDRVLSPASILPFINPFFLLRMTTIALCAWIVVQLSREKNINGVSARMLANRFEYGCYVLFAMMVSLEILFVWKLKGDYSVLSLLMFYAVMGWIMIEIASRNMRPPSLYSLLCCSALFMAGLLYLYYCQFSINVDLLFLNIPFSAKMFVIGVVGYSLYRFRSMDTVYQNKIEKQTFTQLIEVVLYAIVLYTLYVEIDNWVKFTKELSPLHKHGILSTCWSLLAFGLIYFGLATRSRYRRLTGFAVFLITISKIMFYDMSVVQPVYRIVSFFVCGVFLIIAGYYYQRYAKQLEGEDSQ
jgi:hypothetical protein